MIAFAIAAGLGAIFRFALERTFNRTWYLGTLLANGAGSFLLGVAVARDFNPAISVFCGAFTTFGGFIGQSFFEKQKRQAVLYVAITVTSSIALAWCGLQLG